jgi:hypothetical protein
VEVSIAGVKTVNFSNNIIEFSNSGVQTLWLSNNQLQAATGSAAAPTYTFAADTSTGFYRAAATEVRYATQGVDRVYFQNNRLGINISPGTALDVSGVARSRTGIVTSGYFRDGITPSTLDISGGNISNSALTRSSNFRGSDGSVSVPTYSFASDPSTGLHLVGPSTLAFDTSGVQRMCISGGLVGIGTANPQWALDVSGPGAQKIQVSGQDAAVNIQDQRVADPFVLFQNNANYGVFSFNALPFWLYQSNAVRLAISNGNVGVGTTAPTSTLDVFSGAVVINRLGNITNTTDVSAVVEGSCNAGMYWQKGSNNSNIGVSFRTLCNNVIAERLRIDANTGRVGIGTSSPAFTLDVCGNANVQLGNGTGSFYVGGSTTGIIIQRDIGGNGYLRPLGTGVNLYLGTGSSNTMTILSTGSVGLGTPTPGYALDICGSAGLASVNSATWTRQSITSFFWVRGHCNANVSTYRVRWNTTSVNFPSTSILDWQDNATHGSYFRILKPGIWSISYMVVTSAAGYSWIDASSSFSNGYSSPTAAGNGDLIAGGSELTGTGTYPVRFTGFLPSNANRYYRFSSTNQTNGAVANTNPYLTIALLYETPDTGLTFFSA